MIQEFREFSVSRKSSSKKKSKSSSRETYGRETMSRQHVGHYYRSTKEISCCTKYFLFSFNILFWVSFNIFFTINLNPTRLDLISGLQWTVQTYKSDRSSTWTVYVQPYGPFISIRIDNGQSKLTQDRSFSTQTRFQTESDLNKTVQRRFQAFGPFSLISMDRLLWLIAQRPSTFDMRPSTKNKIILAAWIAFIDMWDMGLDWEGIFRRRGRIDLDSTWSRRRHFIHWICNVYFIILWMFRGT